MFLQDDNISYRVTNNTVENLIKEVLSATTKPLIDEKDDISLRREIFHTRRLFEQERFLQKISNDLKIYCEASCMNVSTICGTINLCTY